MTEKNIPNMMCRGQYGYKIMLVPVLNIKMERGHKETRPAQIALVSIMQKITNLITTMDFIQTDAVIGTVKKTTYKMYFISDDRTQLYCPEQTDRELSSRVG